MNNIIIALQNGDLPEHLGVIGYAGDKNCSSLLFAGAEADRTYVLDMAHEQSGEKNILALANDNGTLRAVLDGTVVIPAGRYLVQLRTVGDVVWHSSCGHLIVREAINAADGFPDPVPSEFKQMEQRILQAQAEKTRLFFAVCEESAADRTLVPDAQSSKRFDTLQDGDIFLVQFAAYPVSGLTLCVGNSGKKRTYTRWASASSYNAIPSGAWQNGSVRTLRYQASADHGAGGFILCDFGHAFNSSSQSYYGAVRLSDRTDLSDSSYAATAKAVAAVMAYAKALEQRIAALEPVKTVTVTVYDIYPSPKVAVTTVTVPDGTTWRQFAEQDDSTVTDEDGTTTKRWNYTKNYVNLRCCVGGLVYNYPLMYESGGYVKPDDVIAGKAYCIRIDD